MLLQFYASAICPSALPKIIALLLVVVFMASFSP